MGFDRFITERKYLHNVSVRTLEWYSQSFHWLGKETPTQDDITDCVIRMRDAGLTASSVNNRLRAINAYLHWGSATGSDKCGTGCRHLKVPRLKEEQRVLPTFHVQDIDKVSRWKPTTFGQHRTQVLMLTLVDTGIRIDEALTLAWDGVSFDDLLLCVFGKGRKERRVPFSVELRRYLYRWRNKSMRHLVFPSATGRQMDRRNVLRDAKEFCDRIHVAVPERTIHALRHTFAVTYLRNGGSVFHLQKILGHSSLEMTRRYANLVTEDLQAVHQRLSILGGMGRAGPNR